MRQGILINARLGSTRLERKHLLSLQGQPILNYLVERIRIGFHEEIESGSARIILATSDEKENRQFEELFVGKGDVFYGAINNLPLRQLQASKKFSLSHIISVDGDDILCSVQGMKEVYKALAANSPYVKTANLPFGMNSFGYNKEFLEKSMEGHVESVLETGWGHVFDETRLTQIDIPFKFQNDRLRFSLDYKEDFEFFKAIIQHWKKEIITASDEDIVEWVVSKEIFKINQSIVEKYWKQFQKNVEDESSHSTSTSQ